MAWHVRLIFLISFMIHIYNCFSRLSDLILLCDKWFLCISSFDFTYVSGLLSVIYFICCYLFVLQMCKAYVISILF